MSDTLALNGMTARLRNSLASWFDVLGAALRVWPVGGIWALVAYPVSGLTGPAAALALGRIVDDFAGARRDQAAVWVMVLVVTIAVSEFIRQVNAYAGWRLGELVEHDVTQRVMRASLLAPGVAHLEDPDIAETLHHIRESPGRFGYVVYTLRLATAGTVGVAAATIALASVAPVLAIAPLVAGLLGLVHARPSERAREALEQGFAIMRRSEGYELLCTNRAAAKETRVLGMGQWAIGQKELASRGSRRAFTRLSLLEARVATVRALIHGSALAAGVAWIVHLAATGKATSGDVAMGVGMLQQVFEHTNNLAHAVTQTGRFQLVSRAIRRLLDYESPVARPEVPVAVPRRLDRGIRLDGVSFTYPGADRPALSDVSVELAAGSTVALVGENGAGKTTLVKLLCRFYDLERGRIDVDGIDLADLDPVEWRSRLTGAFQDFAHYSFTVREAIGVGDVTGVGDDRRVLAAAESVGAADLVRTLSLDTRLGRSFVGGAELSTGQWQKIALARAAMRADALVTVLDEPTAALDPRAEHEVFERFAAIAKQGRDHGAITVVISHRFSTVLMADVIVVLNEGRVVEIGSHGDLMARGGRYAEMFTLQASSYKS